MAELVWNNEHNALNKAFGTSDFGKKLEDAMARQGGERTKYSFAPSGLGYSGSCPRYWYYAFNGAEFTYDTDAPSMANMNAGTDAGRRLAKVLKDADLLVDAEVEARHKNPPIFGFIDAMVRWRGEVIPAEIKTTKAETWKYRALNNTVPGYQLLQLLIYMHVTKKDKGFFLTENKNTHEIFILPVKMTPENQALVDRTLEWMRKVKKNADEGELPTRPFTPKSMQCKGCPVREKCWEGYVRGSVNGSDPNPGTITLEVLEIPK